MQFKLSDVNPDNAHVLSFLADAAMHYGEQRVGLRHDTTADVVKVKSEEGGKRSRSSEKTAKIATHSPSSKRVKIERKANSTPPIEDARKKIPTLDISSIPRDIGGHKTKNCTAPGMQQPIAVMTDSTAFFTSGNDRALFEAFDRDGYLLIRNVIEKGMIQSVQDYVKGVLTSSGAAAIDGTAICKRGWTVDTTSGVFIPGSSDYVTSKIIQNNPHEHMWDHVASEKSVVDLKSSREVKEVFQSLARGRSAVDGETITPRAFSPQFAWMRVKAPGECTPEHSDAFYFLDYTTMFSPVEDPTAVEDLRSLTCSKCLQGDREDELIICDECNCCTHLDCLAPALARPPDDNWYCSDCKQRPTLVSCWTPLGDVQVNDGVLCVLAGSHKLPNFDIPEKKRPSLPMAYRSQGKHMTWVTTDFKAGDVVLFNSKAVHCSTRNYHKGFRISIDTRWVLAPQKRTNFGKTAPSRYILKNSFEAK